MTVLLESLVPIFLLIVLGVALRHSRLASAESWIGLERISYFVFFPALLFQTIYKADFSRLTAAGSAGAFLLGIGLLLALMILIRPFLQRMLGVGNAAYTSVYQATTRWNAFVILAITERIAQPDMLAVVAIGIAVMVIPINVANVAVLSVLGDREGERPAIWLQIARNPMVLGVLAGIVVRVLGLTLPAPLAVAIELLARVSLPLGLILLGSGLRLAMPAKAFVAVGVGVMLKLLLMPLVLGASAWLFGIRGEELAIVALCGAGPAAMNGYVLAREMGGDAPLFAAMATAQTVVAFLTIPLVLAIAGMPGL